MSDVATMTDVEVLQATEQIRLLEARYARFAVGPAKRFTKLMAIMVERALRSRLLTRGPRLETTVGRSNRRRRSSRPIT